MTALHFYDASTVGRNPAEGQITMYHSVLIPENGEAELLQTQVRLRDDVFVDPAWALEADLATLDINAGVSELDWARSAYRHFTTPKCLHIGLGGASRLDSFIRYGFYRNLLPHPCSGIPPQSHFLELDTLIRVVALLRPGELPWANCPDPLSGRGLGHFLMWESAVTGQNRALRLKEVLGELCEASPRLVEHAIKMSSIEAVKSAMGLDGGEVSDLLSVQPCLLVHPTLPNARHAVLGFPVAVDISYPEIVYLADLECDLTELCDPDAGPLKRLVRSHADEMEKPLVRVNLSRFPFCSSISAVRREDASRLGIALSNVQGNIELLRSATQLAARLRDEDLLELPPQPADVDHRLWAGDFPATDVVLMNQLHSSGVDQWPGIIAAGVDGRFRDLGKRLIGRTKPVLLAGDELERWRNHCRTRAGGDFGTPDRVERHRKQAQDIAQLFPAAVGLSLLHERLTRIVG